MPTPVPVSSLFAIFPEIILGIAACIIFVWEPFVPKEKRDKIAYFSLFALILSGLSLFLLCGQNISAFSGMIVIDAYAIAFKALLVLSSIFVVLMSFQYVKTERIHLGEYYGLILFATIGMMFLPSASDLLSFYLALELMSMSFYVLTAFMRKDEKSLEAGVKYFLVGIFTSGLILYAIAFIYGITGTTHLGAIRATLAGVGNANVATNPALIFATILLIAGFGFKIASVPFQMWAPDVYEGSPTTITAFLSVGSKLAALSVMGRVFVFGLDAYSADWQPILWIISVLTMTLGNVAALVQTNFKRLLAYSSIGHSGYFLIGLIVKSESGMSAIFVHSVAYLFMTLGAFVMILLVCKEGSRGDQISDLRGLGRSHPVIGIAFVLFALSLIGIPPTAGFIGKLLLFGSAIEGQFYGLAVIGVLNSVISLYYYFKVATVMFMEEPSQERTLSFSIPIKIGLWAMSIATLVIGLYPEPIIRAALHSVKVLF
ncbi:MAG: NADH-quinone oxidoreductase subunit N [Nitrospirota bacterium]